MPTVSQKEVQPEFRHFLSDDAIPWDNLIKAAGKRTKKDVSSFEAFTDVVIDLASKESMKEKSNPSILRMGAEAGLLRGRLAECLFISDGSSDPDILSLRAICLFVLSDTKGIIEALKMMESEIGKNSPPGHQVKLSTVKILLAAAEKDTSVITCIMEFDNLLEAYPEQVEKPTIETMFALYVVGFLLREVGQLDRAAHIVDTLEEMARSRNHRMMLALVENLRGNICSFRGEFDRAKEHYLRLQSASAKLSFDLGHAMALNNLGNLMLSMLKLEEAFGYLDGALELMQVEYGKIMPLTNLGELSIIMGRYEDAEKYLTQAIRIDEKVKRGILEPYTWYAVLLTKTSRFPEARKYLKKAKAMAKSSEKPLEQGAYLYARGVYDTSQHKFAAAIKHFEKALRTAKDNDILELLVHVKPQLAKMYVESHSITKDPEDITSAAYHIGDLIQISKEQGLQDLYAEALLLRSDIMKLAGKRLEAKGDLERALSVASFTGNYRLEEEANIRLREVIAPEAQAMEMDREGFSKAIDRVSAFKPAGSLKQVPTPTVSALIAIDRTSGLPEYVYYFDTKVQVDSSLVSGFVTAISSFTNELMETQGLLRSINHEGFALLMEHTESRTVALVASEETFDIRYLLREFSLKFDEKYPTPEASRGIDSKDYDNADDLVKQVFAAAMATREA
ncbi:MAG: tetratricopeptide repeat protein [Candidatus Thorarchaeota archaeon]